MEAPTAAPVTALALNQDGSLLLICGEHELKVVASDPMGFEAFKDDFDLLSIQIVAPLGRTQLVALAGSDRFGNPKAVLYDLEQGAAVLEFDSLEPITAMQLRPEALVVATESRLAVFNLTAAPQDPRILDCRIMSAAHLAVSCPSEPGAVPLLAFPHPTQVGSVVLTPCSAAADAPLVAFEAHDSALAALAIDDAGTLVATASANGTIIRVSRADVRVCPPAERRVCAMRNALGSVFSTKATVLALALAPGAQRPILAAVVQEAAALSLRFFDTAKMDAEHGSLTQSAANWALEPPGAAIAGSDVTCAFAGPRVAVVGVRQTRQLAAVTLSGPPGPIAAEGLFRCLPPPSDAAL